MTESATTEIRHVVIPKGHKYNDAITLYTVSWNRITNTFSVTFAPGYWNYFKSEPEREAALYRIWHLDALVSRLESIIKTGDWPPELSVYTEQESMK